MSVEINVRSIADTRQTPADPAVRVVQPGRQTIARRFRTFGFVPSLLLALRCALIIGAVFGAQGAYAQFLSSPVTSVTVGEPYVYNVQAAGDGRVNITAPYGLPEWLSLQDMGNGRAVLSGVSSDPNTNWTVTLRAEDNRCSFFTILCETQTFNIAVSGPPNGAPTVVPPGLQDQSSRLNEFFSLDVSPAFTDPDGDPLSFTATGLPAGLAFSGVTISGVPVTDAESPYSVTVTADDQRGGIVSDVFLLTVVPLDSADIFIDDLSATPGPALSGAPIDFAVTVGNTGPSPSGAIDLTLEFSGNLLSFETGACTLTVVGDQQHLVCPLGPVDAGASETLTVTASAAQPGDVFVSATLESPAYPVDPDLTNNSAASSLNIGSAIASDAAQLVTLAAGAVAAADLDGDGYSDAAVASLDGGAPSLLLNSAAPTGLHESLSGADDERRGLGAPVALADAAGGADVALVDFDNDEDLDAVVANGPEAASAVFLNDGEGGFSLLAELGQANADDRALAAADVDGDGFADLVIASSDANRLFLNQGGTGFAAPVAIAVGAAAAADAMLVDVIGSGLPDLVIAYAGPAVVHENLGGGEFAEAVSFDPGPGSSLATGDFNGDGYADIVLGRAAPGPDGRPSNPVYLNNGSGGFLSVAVLGGSPSTDVLTADFDGDGATDIVSVNVTGAHQIFLGDGNGGFALQSELIASPGASRAAVAAIGRLQLPDLIFALPDGIEVFFNDGTGHLGLGDTERPVIALIGAPEVILEVQSSYTDAGATVTDNYDDDLTPTVVSTVEQDVIGTYTVTYTAIDSAGNAAQPVARTVRIQPRAASGGGGGATGWLLVLLLVSASIARRIKRSPIGALPALRAIAAALAMTGLAASALASELSYTFMEFGALNVETSATGTQSPILDQLVEVGPGKGEGVTVGGSLAFGERFYIAGDYNSAVLDVEALVSSPLAVAMVAGTFDFIASRAALGYAYPIGNSFDLVGEITYDTLEYDFGSFAGESFDIDDSGAGLGLGFRWNPRPELEVFGMAHGSSVGKADLTARALDSGTRVSAGMRWYFFDDLGLGLRYQNGDFDSLTITMSFGFGELRAGGN
jgi:hypothetical protein